MRLMVGIYQMDIKHLYGGMVKDMYLEELNAPPFLVCDENLENCERCVAAPRAKYLA